MKRTIRETSQKRVFLTSFKRRYFSLTPVARLLPLIVSMPLVVTCFQHFAYAQINPGHQAKLINGSGLAPHLQSPLNIFVAGNFAYVCTGNGNGTVEIVDITNPNVPVHKGSIQDGDGGASLYTPRGIIVVGNYAFVASEGGNAFEVLDVSDPANPHHAAVLHDGGGSAPFLSNPIGLTVSGNYAYVTGFIGKSLEIIDISDPLNPKHKGGIVDGAGVAPYLNGAYDVKVDGDYAYVVSRLSNSLEIFNVSDPSHPVRAGGLKDGDGSGALLKSARSIGIKATKLFIASANSNAIEVVDISNPQSPSHAGSIVNGQQGASLNKPFALTISGNYAYVVNSLGNSLEVIDISVPATPTHVGTLLNGTDGCEIVAPWNLAISGNSVFIPSQNTSSLEIVDVSNPASPTHVSVLEGGTATPPYLDRASAFAQVGSYAYVVSSTGNSFEIIDISDPKNPSHKSALLDGGVNPPFLNSASSVAVSGNYAYVGSLGAFEVIDISNPSAPVHKGSLLDGGGSSPPYLLLPYSMAIVGNRAYLVDYDWSALEIIDISNPSAPSHVGSLAAGSTGSVSYLGQPSSIAVNGNYAYVTDQNPSALEVIDISNPSTPTFVGRLADGGGSAPFLNFPARISISGSYAYVASSNALEIVDISTPSSPTHVGSLLDGNGSAPYLQGPNSISVSGGLAYVASQTSNAFEIIDVSNPAAPVHHSSLLDGQTGASLQTASWAVKSGNYAYISSVNSFEVAYLFYPAVSSFLPVTGSVGTTVSISGLNYNSNMTVYIGGTQATPSNISATGASIVIPAGAQIGKIAVTVDGHAINSAEDFIVTPTATAATLPSESTFTANWSDVGAAYYYIDVSADNFSTFVTGFNNQMVLGTSTQITGLNANSTYQYRVRSSNGSSASSNSNTVSALTLTTAPAATAATAIAQTSFTANWSSVVGATNYALDVSTDNAFTSMLSGYNNQSVSATSQGVSGLSTGTTYYYRVRSDNASGASLASNIISVITIPSAPIGLTANNDLVSFTANWSAAAGATNYFVDVSPDNFNTFVSGYNNLSVGNVTALLVTGLTSGTSYRFRIRAGNASGASNNSAVAIALTLPSAPIAQSAGSVSLNTFNANWTAVESATAYLLDVASSSDFVQILANYNALALGNVTSSAVNGLTASTTYYYRVRAVNGSGNSVYSNVVSTTTSGTVTIPSITAAGGTIESYDMFSIPLVLTDSTIATVFKDLGPYSKDKWRLLQFSSSKNKYLEYDQNDGLNSIDRGNAYWFNTTEAPVKVQVTGFSFSKPTFQMTLSQGWNQIGSPYNFDVSWTDVLTNNSSNPNIGNVEKNIYKYVQSPAGFAQTDNLKAWSGNFVFNKGSAITLSIPSSVKHAIGGRMASDQSATDLSGADWFVALALSIDGAENSYSGFGMHPDAHLSIDKFDGITVPRFMHYVELNSYHPEFFTPEFSRDFVPTSKNFNWRFLAESNYGSKDATLSWDKDALGNSQAMLVLFDPATGSIIDMTIDNQYHFQLDERHPLHFFFAVDKEHFKPDITSLASVYPNPVTTSVHFPFFTSDRAEAVQLEVFDVMGKKVKTVINGIYQPGLQQVQWDASDEQGIRVPQGVYVYRFVGASNTVQSGKLVIK